MTSLIRASLVPERSLFEGANPNIPPPGMRLVEPGVALDVLGLLVARQTEPGIPDDDPRYVYRPVDDLSSIYHGRDRFGRSYKVHRDPSAPPRKVWATGDGPVSGSGGRGAGNLDAPRVKP